MYNQPTIVHLLIERGADVTALDVTNNRTALQMAKALEYEDIAHLLGTGQS